MAELVEFVSDKENESKGAQLLHSKIKVGYVHSEILLAECDKVPNLKSRASMVHHLIDSYGLLNSVIPITSSKIEDEQLQGFHSADYINFIKGEIEEDNDENEEYGLGYDCPPLDDLHEFIRVIAGSSISGATALATGQVDVAVNFCGGWHHAQRDQASGFCYVNDCVLAILELEKKFKKVLYVDLDIHHGDGVENAFAYSKKVFTMSVHKYEEGYFPGTGALKDIGLGGGRYYACNVPLMDGTSDATFVHVFQIVCREVMSRFRPEVIVCQCGADGLSGDPLGTFNLTPQAYNRCLAILRESQLPILLLGGGGYHKANAARCFVSVLAGLLNVQLAPDIPEHDFFHFYGPSFELEVSPSLRKDENTSDYIRRLLQQLMSNLQWVS